MNLISVMPHTLCKDDFVIKDRDVLTMLRDINADEIFCNFKDIYAVQGRDPELHQSSFLHVVTETVYHYPHNNYGEKTWKPIVNLRPFVLVSVPGALSELQSQGFKTFASWWDEGYDKITDPLERMRSIVDIVSMISKLSLEELQCMLKDMEPILRFNYAHYYGGFREHALGEIEKQCQRNLLPR